MGLIAREIEARGIPTLCFSSALSITEAVNPPRAVFLDFPLGHTTGKPGDPSLQREIMLAALDALRTIDTPGTILTLPHRWDEDDAWKKAAENEGDLRSERTDEPQYQRESDRIAAQAMIEREGGATASNTNATNSQEKSR
ncbi:MAG: hypothetical protein ISN28_10320 [Ectothiorhodospiraceae bacterium AqS1]|nr:hypothetical protein [Ectothiorhodospiraceae bacterium AqS1]